jgi:transposase
MFIRKKANKGGSYSIMLLTGERVPGKKHVVSRMVKNFGSATTEQELEALIQEAESYKTQLEARLPKKIKTLKINADIDLLSCRHYHPGFLDVYGCLFDQTFGQLALKSDALQQLRELVVLRVATPNSKRATVIQAEDYGIDVTLNCTYRLMDRLTPAFIDDIKQAARQRTVSLLAEQKRSVTILFYDLTTLYFETSSQDELRNFGFSKDGKHQHVQIMLAVIVTEEGLLIDYEEFPGNCYEGHTLLPVITKLQTRYRVEKAILVADAALMNKINLQELTANNIYYVIAARIKNMKKEVKQALLHNEYYSPIHTICDEQGAVVDNVQAKKIALETGDSLIAYHSSKRARKDAWERQKDLEKIKYYLQSTGKSKLTSRLKKTYVVIRKDCAIEINPEKLKLEEAYDGFFGLQTNIENPDPKQLLSAYRGLWQVEQTFRIAKSNLEIRPIFHFTPRRIRAHLAICYMALALIRQAQFILKHQGLPLSAEQLHTLIAKMCVVQIKDHAQQLFEITQDHPPDLLHLYKILNIPWRKRFAYLPLSL